MIVFPFCNDCQSIFSGEVDALCPQCRKQTLEFETVSREMVDKTIEFLHRQEAVLILAEGDSYHINVLYDGQGHVQFYQVHFYVPSPHPIFLQADLFLDKERLRMLLLYGVDVALTQDRGYWHGLVYQFIQKRDADAIKRRTAVLNVLIEESPIKGEQIMAATAKRLNDTIEHLWGSQDSRKWASPATRVLEKDIAFLRQAGIPIRYSRSQGNAGYYISPSNGYL